MFLRSVCAQYVISCFSMLDCCSMFHCVLQDQGNQMNFLNSHIDEMSQITSPRCAVERLSITEINICVILISF